MISLPQTTPGPWMIDPGEGPSGDGWNESRDPGYAPFIYAEHENQMVTIAHMAEPCYTVDLPDNPNDDPYETGDRSLGSLSANARLIASAPDLLAALQDVLDDLAHPDAGTVTTETEMKVKAAIQKAYPNE